MAQKLFRVAAAFFTLRRPWFYMLPPLVVGGTLITFRVDAKGNLPRCPDDINSQQWDGCEGVYSPDFGYTKFIGVFHNGTLEGQVTISHTSSGIIYRGGFKNGMRNGYGTSWESGYGEYAGEWRDNKKNGEGTHKARDGSVFVGTFRDGKYWEGTLVKPSGEKYIGHFSGTFYNGAGVLTKPDGTVYSGKFHWGQYVPDAK